MNRFFPLVALSVVIMFNACMCSSETGTHNGTATIVSVSSMEGSCSDPVHILFTFTPDTPGNYQFSNSSDRNITLSLYRSISNDPYPRPLSGEWADLVGLYEGAIFPALRTEIYGGGCMPAHPVTFTLPMIEQYLQNIEENAIEPGC